MAEIKPATWSQSATSWLEKRDWKRSRWHHCSSLSIESDVPQGQGGTTMWLSGSLAPACLELDCGPTQSHRYQIDSPRTQALRQPGKSCNVHARNFPRFYGNQHMSALCPYTCDVMYHSSNTSKRKALRRHIVLYMCLCETESIYSVWHLLLLSPARMTVLCRG